LNPTPNAGELPEARFKITLAGSGKDFFSTANESILDASKRAGLALPYSLRRHGFKR
jgi:ferredoxin